MEIPQSKIKQKTGPKPGLTVWKTKPGPKVTPQVMDLRRQIEILKLKMKADRSSFETEIMKLKRRLKKRGIHIVEETCRSEY